MKLIASFLNQHSMSNDIIKTCSSSGANFISPRNLNNKFERVHLIPFIF